jgi:hypothetical protein
MANSLLYIAGPFRCISPAFCRGDGSSGVLFGALLFGFGFRLAGPARMA